MEGKGSAGKTLSIYIGKGLVNEKKQEHRYLWNWEAQDAYNQASETNGCRLLKYSSLQPTTKRTTNRGRKIL